MKLYSLRRAASPTSWVHQCLAQTWRHSALHNRGFATSRAFAKEMSDPLRILFCGSDDFSCESLKELYAEHRRDRALVESLEVMVMPAKRMGRGLKQLARCMCCWIP